jgi:hypothetical protein
MRIILFLAFGASLSLFANTYECDKYSISYSELWDEKSQKGDNLQIYSSGLFGRVSIEIFCENEQESKRTYSLLEKYSKNPRIYSDLSDIFVRYFKKHEKKNISHIHIGMVNVNGNRGWRRIYSVDVPKQEGEGWVTIFIAQSHFPTDDGAIIVDVIFGHPNPLIGSRVRDVLSTLVIH